MPFRPVTSYNIATSTVSAQGPAIGSSISTVRVSATVETYIALGANPTATVAAGVRIPANVDGELFHVKEGEKIAAIVATGTGSVNITEMSR